MCIAPQVSLFAAHHTPSSIMSVWGSGKTLAEKLKEEKNSPLASTASGKEDTKELHLSEEKPHHASHEENVHSQKEKLIDVVPPSADVGPSTPLPETEENPSTEVPKAVPTIPGVAVRLPSSWAAQVSSGVSFSGSSLSVGTSPKDSSSLANKDAVPPSSAADEGEGVAPSPLVSSSKSEEEVPASGAHASPAPRRGGPRSRQAGGGQAHHSAGAEGGYSHPSHFAGGNRRGRGGRRGPWIDRGGRFYANAYEAPEEYYSGLLPGGEFGAIPFDYRLTCERKLQEQQYAPSHFAGGPRFRMGHPFSNLPFPGVRPGDIVMNSQSFGNTSSHYYPGASHANAFVDPNADIENLPPSVSFPQV